MVLQHTVLQHTVLQQVVSLRPPLFALALLGLTLSSRLPSQSEQQEKAVLAGSRVSRCLQTLEKAPNYAFEGAMLGSANPMMAILRRAGRQGGKAAKVEPTLIQGVRKGSLLCWTRREGKDVLATLGARWVQRDRDGHWIPSRGPQGSWKNQEFNDPRFLAARLLELKSKIEWKIQSGVTLDERPVRCYLGKISGKNATLLFRSGALPAGGASGGLGQIIMMRAGGGNLRMPETLREVHIKILEDPRSHLPLTIECQIFAKQDPNAGVRIAIGGMGGQQDDEDEDELDENGEKKRKPTFTYTLTFSQFGKATVDNLDAKARQLLGLKNEAPTTDPTKGKAPTKR